MFSIHTDTENKQFVVEDYKGKVYAVKPWPFVGVGATAATMQNAQARNDLLLLVKLANLGDRTAKSAETEIIQLQRMLNELE